MEPAVTSSPEKELWDSWGRALLLNPPSSFPFHLSFLGYVMQAEDSSSRAYDPEEPRQAQTQTVTLLQSHRHRK